MSSSTNTGNGVADSLVQSNSTSAAVSQVVAVRWRSGLVGSSGRYTLKLVQ